MDTQQTLTEQEQRLEEDFFDQIWNDDSSSQRMGSKIEDDSYQSEDVSIPERLRNDRFRFCLVGGQKHDNKGAFEKGWNKYENGYSHNDLRLRQHLANGGNYGVIAGYNNLLIIDVDSEKGYKALQPLLPSDTFIVRSGSYTPEEKYYKKHYYYICKHIPHYHAVREYKRDENGSIIMNGAKPEREVLVEFMYEREEGNKGPMVVGPNSIHPTGNRYEIENDVEPYELSKEEFDAIFEAANELDEVRNNPYKKPQKSYAYTYDGDDERRDYAELVKEQVDFQSYVDHYYPGLRKGRTKIRCPFHDDSHPSAQINEDNIYCHTCDEMFDVINIVRHEEGLGFWKSLQFLIEANDLDIELPNNRKDWEPTEDDKETSDFNELEDWIAKLRDKNPTLKEKSIPRWEMETLQKYNKEFGVVAINGKDCIIRDLGKKGEMIFMKDSFMNTFLSDPVKTINKDEEPKWERKPKVWFTSCFRKEYDGVEFEPAGGTEGYYNFWKGFAVDPKPGRWDRYKDNIWENIACRNEEIYEYILNWCAYMFQNIGKWRPGVSLVLRGDKGVGKGVFASNIKEIFGIHGMHITRSDSLTNTHNESLKGKAFVFVDEAIWAGNRGIEGALKGMITEKPLEINPKHRPQYEISNHMWFVFASNNSWVVPASFDERRFCVLDVGNKHIQDGDYFKAIAYEMENGGREAFLYDMLNRDLKDVDIRDYPQTDALIDQITRSLSGTPQGFILEYLQNEEEYEPKVVKKTFYEMYLKYVRNNSSRKRPIIPENQKSFGKIVSQTVDWSPYRPTINGERPEAYNFGNLEQARMSFEKNVGRTINW